LAAAALLTDTGATGEDVGGAAARVGPFKLRPRAAAASGGVAKRPPIRAFVILGRDATTGHTGSMPVTTLTLPRHAGRPSGPCAAASMTTIICSQMTTHSSQKGIAALFASATIGPLLRALVLQPQREFYQRELQRLTGAHLRQLQRDLARLSESGFVESRVHGNRVYYRAVASDPAFPALRSLVLTTVGLGDTLREALLALGEGVEAAFIYGSFARGDETADSDVDLLVVGDVTRRALASALAPAGRELGRELNPALFWAAEFAARRRGGDHFVSSVLVAPRIWLVGDDSTLAALG